MTENDYIRWTNRIHYLISKKNSIKTQDASKSTWHNHSTQTEGGSLYKSDEEAEQARNEIDDMINEILHMLNEEGYDTTSIMEKYDEKSSEENER